MCFSGGIADKVIRSALSWYASTTWGRCSGAPDNDRGVISGFDIFLRRVWFPSDANAATCWLTDTAGANHRFAERLIRWRPDNLNNALKV
jgi:hypothetical protein